MLLGCIRKSVKLVSLANCYGELALSKTWFFAFIGDFIWRILSVARLYKGGVYSCGGVSVVVVCGGDVGCGGD